jgi:hypothetical protein
VRSTPAGARVRLDGRDVGRTPLTLRDVREGAHMVSISHEGYLAEERRVAITPDRPARSLLVELGRSDSAGTTGTVALSDRSGATLFVDSRPVGATVFLDGRPIGTTPLQISDVATGEHAVGLELEGYRRWSSSVRVVAGERNRVAASLEQ